MDILPNDILKKIGQDFISLKDKEDVAAKLATLWATNLNVGPDQLARCILILSEGNIEIVNEIFESNFYGDPRDLILSAIEKSGKTINYGIDKFRIK